MRVAISGLAGCGKNTVSKLVAERLGLQEVNYTFRELASDKGVGFEELRRQAEEKFPEVDFELDSKQVELLLASPDCVIASRLAAWLDDERVLNAIGAQQKFKFDYKFWLEAPLETRAARIAKREGRELEEAVESVKARDAADSSRYERAYGVRLSEHSFARTMDAGEPSAEEVAAEIAGCVS